MEQKYPEPTVGALIVNAEGKILLAKSPKWFDKYVLPGGHIELGETYEDAVIRETKEEVGLNVRVKRLLCIQNAIFSPETTSKRHFVFLSILCESPGGEAAIDGREITEAVWVDPKEALTMPINSFTRESIQQYLNV